MNTNSNTYTVVYSTIIVVLVAALLAFVAMALKPKQDANIKAETISQMLNAAQLATSEELASMGNDQVLAKYQETIKEAFLVNDKGEKVRDLSVDPIELAADLKAQNTLIKKGANESLELPVYIFNNETTVVPVYGAGLWGPVWGYVAFGKDLKTVNGAYFDHSGETPGLGAKIKDDPSFRASFIGKVADFGAEKALQILKGATQDNQVDAITGATMTSKGLSEAIEAWLACYKPYFQGGEAAGCGKCADCSGECEGECEGEGEETTNEVEE